MKGLILGVGATLWLTGCDARELQRELDQPPSATREDAAPAAELQRDDTGAAGTGRIEVVLADREGKQIGTATLVQEPRGVRIAVSVDGVKPGRLGFHIHEHGRCDPPDFESAGGHFAPAPHEHGEENPEGPHAGDLPNLRVGPDGRGENETLNPLVSLNGGEASLRRDGGTSLIIHEGTDDYYTDPTGDAGDRIACGVIGR